MVWLLAGSGSLGLGPDRRRWVISSWGFTEYSQLQGVQGVSAADKSGVEGTDWSTRDWGRRAGWLKQRELKSQ